MPRVRPSFRTRAPRPDARRLLAAALGGALAAGCAGATRSPAGAGVAPAESARLITRGEIERSGYLTPQALVGALRPEWLLRLYAARRGPDTLLDTGPPPEPTLGYVYVHADSARGILRRFGPTSATNRPPFPIAAVTAIEFVPPSTVVVFGRDAVPADGPAAEGVRRARAGVGR